jgi:cystathionine gamma-synthase
MAAIAAVLDQLPVGARIVWPDDCYQGVARLITDGERLGRWTATRLAVDDTDAWLAAVATADLTWIESPSNPLLHVADLRRIADAARPDGSILAIDNTLAGPLAQQPLELGVDIAVQSATKHLGGHSDLLCGVATTRRSELAAALRKHRELRGATPGTLETYLATRGIRTYALRAAAAAAAALELAHRLEAHQRVAVVRYPGLASHGTHRIARAHLANFGSIISFDVAGGATAADAVCRQVRLIHHATSFGAVESTIERRAAVPGQEHLPAGLLRLSVGIEHIEDIWDDLHQAL